MSWIWLRTVGDNHELQRFSTWCPKAFASIGKLPATLASRSIHIPLRRKTPEERVVRLKRSESALDELKHKMARWAADNAQHLIAARPLIPDALYSRSADNWEPLLAIADLVGGEWPERARAAALALTGKTSEQTAGIMVLEDIRSFFRDRNVTRLASEDICTALAAMEARPWPEWGSITRSIAKGSPCCSMSTRLSVFATPTPNAHIGRQGSSAMG
jgi:putative DNA primase/helicase